MRPPHELARVEDAPQSGDPVAENLRGFGPYGILAILVILAGNFLVVPLSAVLVLIWAERSRTPWRDLGFVRPANWGLSLLTGIALGVAFKLLMKSVVMPLLGADPINQAFQHLVGNTAALPGMLLTVTIGAGFGEETLFRGYMFERFGKVFGTSARAKTFAVLSTSALFGAAHCAVQGLPGVQQATIFGFVFGAVFAVTGRIWTLIFAHAAFDLAAVAIIYWNLESSVAHLFFD